MYGLEKVKQNYVDSAGKSSSLDLDSYYIQKWALLFECVSSCTVLVWKHEIKILINNFEIAGIFIYLEIASTGCKCKKCMYFLGKDCIYIYSQISMQCLKKSVL
jgi:hypothetical protein